MYHHYAQIDKNGYIVGISHLSGEMYKPNMIQIDEDFDPTNKKWNGASWESYTPPEPPEPEPTLDEQILSGVNSTNESQLILMDALAYQYEINMENDLNNKEVIATIYEELLAQKGVK